MRISDRDDYEFKVKLRLPPQSKEDRAIDATLEVYAGDGESAIKVAKGLVMGPERWAVLEVTRDNSPLTRRA